VKIAVCWKWLSLDREAEADRRWAGVSPADEAALEIALRIDSDRADDGSGGSPGDVRVVCLGPPESEETLRQAIAAGAGTALRIDASPELDSLVVATALAEHVRGADLVLCGDYSIDRGTGSVPAFLAAELGAAQALGLIEVQLPDGPAVPIRVVRRLDGGRREILDVPTPAVLSVEGSVARLRRASLAASLAARTAPVAVVNGPHGRLRETEVHPYRPRARSLPAPQGTALMRVRGILDVGGSDGRTEAVVLDPPAAAARIVAQLTEWGYVGSTGPAALPIGAVEDSTFGGPSGEDVSGGVS
jgi:electron transfer flavoprotein beta subunit